jgi:hypothetical protein
LKKAIKKYYKQFEQWKDYYKYEDFSDVSKDILKKFNNGTSPVKRKVGSDLSCFKNIYGYDLPGEIVDYINEYWHAWISGYCETSECVILFAVLKKEGDTDEDVLYYNNSLMDLAKKWDEIGDIKRFVPIGWLGYSGGNVLYEVSTSNIYLENVSADVDGKIESEPIANSLKELIENLKIKKL